MVVGAGGLIGRAIVEHLRSSPHHQVVGLVSPRLDPELGGGMPAVDILDSVALRSHFKLLKPKVVINAAGRAHARTGTAEMDVNSQGAANVAKASSECGAMRLLHLSSVSVYGPSHGRELTEDTEPAPRGEYAESKLLGEILARGISEERGLPLTVLRLAMVPSVGNYSNLEDLARAIIRRRFLWVGDGSNLKSFVPLADLVNAVALEATTAPVPGTEIFNVAASPLPMREIVECLAEGIGVAPPARNMPKCLARMLSVVAGGLGGIPTTATLDKFLSNDAVSSKKFERRHGGIICNDPRAALRDYGKEFSARFMD